MNPTIGRIVLYKLTDEDKKTLKDAFKIPYNNTLGPATTGENTLVYDGSGRTNNNQDVLPAIIVATWGPTCINAQVIVDGNTGVLWKTSINQGEGVGQWNWPVIAPVTPPRVEGDVPVA